MSSSKTINLDGGGSITLTVDVDVFTLQAEQRELVFGLIEVFNECSAGIIGDSIAEQAPIEHARKSHKKVTPEIVEKAFELVKNGSTVSAAAAKLGVHRNSLRNAGITFGCQTLGGVPEKPLTPFVCRDCGGKRSAGASRCKDCYAKIVAANKEAEERYQAGVAERKRQRELKATTPRPAEPEKQEEQPIVEEIPIQQPAVSGEDAVKKLANDLHNDHIAQCRKLGIRPDASYAEFAADARAIIAWQKDHPGEPYVARYNGKVTTEDLSIQSFTQYQSPKTGF